MEQKTFKIFLTSSNELSDERVAFANFIRKLNRIYKNRGMEIDVIEWEDFDASITDRRTQDDFNNKVRESDMFVAMFYTKAGEYTVEEFDVAMDEYRKKGSPKVYVYCKKLKKGKAETHELKAFKRRLSEKGNERFWTNYSNQESLQLHFVQQFLMVENGLSKLELENGAVKLGGETVAQIDQLPFAAGNKDYQRIRAELSTLPKAIESARQFLDKHPDNDYMRGELQEKLNRYNALKEEFARLQQTLFDTSQHVAVMQREQLSDKLRRATEAFEAGNMERANKLIDETELKAETLYANLNQARELVHQDIKAFLLRAKTAMAEVNTPIKERIKQVQAIYVKADEWAMESALPDEKYDGLLFDYARFFKDYGLYKEAESVYLRLISLREKLYGKEHEDTATSYDDIGVLYDYQGDYAKALKYQRKALDIRERVLGPDHPMTATSYNSIGHVYDNLGDYAKALEYLGKALDIEERVLGLDHPNTAASYNNIGRVYDNQGDYATALKYYRKALNIREHMLGPDNPDTAASYNNIGFIYYIQGDYNTALKLHEQALDIFERKLGPDHPKTAYSYNNIGLVYNSQGEYAKALEYMSKALDIRERVLGQDNPETAMSYNNIGLIYANQDDNAKALEYYGKALDIQERVLGPDHPHIAITYRNIGSVYDKKGDTEKAKELYNKSLNVKEQMSNHRVLETGNIDSIINNQSDDFKLVVTLKQIIDETVRDYGYNDSKTKRYRMNLCRFLLELA